MLVDHVDIITRVGYNIGFMFVVQYWTYICVQTLEANFLGNGEVHEEFDVDD
jgi:hypothetical protein